MIDVEIEWEAGDGWAAALSQEVRTFPGRRAEGRGRTVTAAVFDCLGVWAYFETPFGLTKEGQEWWKHEHLRS